MATHSDLSAQPEAFDAGVLQQLACPVCFGALQLVASDAQIECLQCKRLYPLVDGIPVLIPDSLIPD